MRPAPKGYRFPILVQRLLDAAGIRHVDLYAGSLIRDELPKAQHGQEDTNAPVPPPT
jgi:hypothetical protein